MKTEDAIEWAGSKLELSRVLGLWPQTVYNWGDYPPKAKQYEIEVKSGGKLKAEPEPVYELKK